jgi:hypothetical protein
MKFLIGLFRRREDRPDFWKAYKRDINRRERRRREVRTQVFAAMVGSIAAAEPHNLIDYDHLAWMADCAARKAMAKWRE